ncbi:MAG: amino acid permease [Gammaproteobacteria bacterium]|nr:amino acid permease [Gammaproteobacteria bacterium]
MTGLKRTLSLPMMVLYGLGTTIGAGVYALVGEVAGIAGYYAPFSFLIAALLAGFTAISFAEICARFPQSAGEAVYVYEGFGSKKLSLLVGLMVTLAGLVSAAALVNAFTGYMSEFIHLQRHFGIFFVCLILGGLAAWGIAESVFIASIITVIEVGGLLLIVFVGHESFYHIADTLPTMMPPFEMGSWTVIFSGVVLSFYAFIGFEDMVNVAEEVRDVKRNLPGAILLTLAITTLLYVLIMLVAVLSVPPEILAQSKAPLAYVYKLHSGDDAFIISIIGMFAIINGALIQTIMASRVLYGLSARADLPALLSVVNPVTQTPLYATATAIVIVLVLALIGELAELAKTTSIIMLVVFCLVNLSLYQIKKNDPRPHGIMVFPVWMPLTGFVVSLFFVMMELINLL